MHFLSISMLVVATLAHYSKSSSSYHPPLLKRAPDVRAAPSQSEDNIDNVKTVLFDVTFWKGDVHATNTASDGTKFQNCGLWVHSDAAHKHGVFFRANPASRRWDRHEAALPDAPGEPIGQINATEWAAHKVDAIASNHVFHAPVRGAAGVSPAWCRRVSLGLRRTWRHAHVLQLPPALQNRIGLATSITGSVALAAMAGTYVWTQRPKGPRLGPAELARHHLETEFASTEAHSAGTNGRDTIPAYHGERHGSGRK